MVTIRGGRVKLQALSAATGVTVPSIKYYLREGLVHPGVKKNATTAVYDDTHRARLDLIQALRQIVGTPVGEIR
jgi:DNA-binding transcriptional MerR regulator